MLSWTIGDVTVKRLVEIEVPFKHSPETPFIAEATPEAIRKMPWLFPHFCTPEGDLKLSIQALLVQSKDIKLIVDTCVGNDKPRALLRGRALQTQFLSELTAAGFSPESVDAVVCTHLHVDHVGWNTRLEAGKWVPTFPNAQYLIGKTEYAHWSKEGDADQQAILADSVKPIFDAGLAREVEMDHLITDEVRLKPTPGHTPGHVGVVIESKGERAVITGDMMHHPCRIAHPEWSPGFDSDKARARATRKAFVEEYADTPTLIIGTHFSAPTAGRILRDGVSYRLAV